MKLTNSTNTIIIGASAAGLATSACLQHEGIDFIVLEKFPQVATKWRNHYDRLHLHTSKNRSSLPFKKFDASLPPYPSRRNVVDYLDEYAQEMNIHPVFNTEVVSVKKENAVWITETNNGSYQSKNIVVATGMNNKPVLAKWQGIESFNGTIIHSSLYKSGKDFTGKNVLVVGFGNSACEQAMCLHEYGAFPALAVRSPVNVLPRDIFGFSVLEIGKLTSCFTARVADKINAPLLRLLVGDITKLGLKKSKYGPREQIEKQRKIPLLDIGTIKYIRNGYIKVYSDILKIEGNTVFFEENKQQEFDAIILATGYSNNLESFLDPTYIKPGNINKPLSKQTDFGKDGIYFCGFYLSPMGMLHEISIEAKKIAQTILSKNNN